MKGVGFIKKFDLHGLRVPRRPIKIFLRVSRWDSGVSTPGFLRVPRRLSPRAVAYRDKSISLFFDFFDSIKLVLDS